MSSSSTALDRILEKLLTILENMEQRDKEEAVQRKATGTASSSAAPAAVSPHADCKSCDDVVNVVIRVSPTDMSCNPLFFSQKPLNHEGVPVNSAVNYYRMWTEPTAFITGMTGRKDNDILIFRARSQALLREINIIREKLDFYYQDKEAAWLAAKKTPPLESKALRDARKTAIQNYRNFLDQATLDVNTLQSIDLGSRSWYKEKTLSDEQKILLKDSLEKTFKETLKKAIVADQYFQNDFANLLVAQGIKNPTPGPVGISSAALAGSAPGAAALLRAGAAHTVTGVGTGGGAGGSGRSGSSAASGGSSAAGGSSTAGGSSAGGSSTAGGSSAASSRASLMASIAALGAAGGGGGTPSSAAGASTASATGLGGGLGGGGGGTPFPSSAAGGSSASTASATGPMLPPIPASAPAGGSSASTASATAAPPLNLTGGGRITRRKRRKSRRLTKNNRNK